MEKIPSPEDLTYMLNHVFLPPKLPQEKDKDRLQTNGDIALCRLAYTAAAHIHDALAPEDATKWKHVMKMLECLLASTKRPNSYDTVDNIVGLEDGDAFVFHIEAQNAGLILRKHSNVMIFEVFEVAPPPADVMGEEGKLLCSYPGPAVEVPIDISQDRAFVEQLVSFVRQMKNDRLDSVATTNKAGSTVEETRSTTDPKYISELLISILRGVGKEAHVQRITKRVADEVCWDNARNPWRRSPFWLVVRVAAQRLSESRDIYKQWMVVLHAKLLAYFLDQNFSSDLLFTTRVKTNRRAWKLGSSAPEWLLTMVKHGGEAVQVELERRWAREQDEQAASDKFVVNAAAFEDDTALSLSSSREYLVNVLRRGSDTSAQEQFKPNEPLRLQGKSLSDISSNALAQSVRDSPHIALADFELVVQNGIDDWVRENIRDSSASQTLQSWLYEYIPAAEKHYASNAEDLSMMLLTVLELWVALDTIVCSQCSLLREYSPEIPISILEPLLLRHGASLARVAQIERYLHHRYSQINTDANPIFSSKFTSKNFSVRYFSQSKDLQSIKASIETDATNERESKRSELEALNSEYAELQRQFYSKNCQYNEVWDRTYRKYISRHSGSCDKCRIERQMGNMRITIHEWPLSSNKWEAEATVFEANPPLCFSTWRDSTYHILRDTCAKKVLRHHFEKHYFLKDYIGLMQWRDPKSSLSRIQFGSSAKSFLTSHYRDVKIPAADDNVCLNNGLCYKLYDTKNSEPVHASLDIDLTPYCTLQLPNNKESAYRGLQYAVTWTTHTHNSTIVKQSDCPIKLSIHEQLAFSNLRCGPLLQWLNILRELRTKVLTFSSEEVHTLLTQAAWQIGPLADDEENRTWHTELGQPEFGFSMIEEASSLLSHVKGNWMEGNTVKTIVYLISRLLTGVGTSQPKLTERAFIVLQDARNTTHGWMKDILERLAAVSGQDHDYLSLLQCQACEMAAICRATYDLDDIHLPNILSSDENVAILVKCAIAIHRYTPHKLDAITDPGLRKLLQRDRRLSYKLELHLSKAIAHDGRGLNSAVNSIWVKFENLSQGWQQLPAHNARWVTTCTTPTNNQGLQAVHYNILDGNLLIDGKPLGHLPKAVLVNTLYTRVFGQKIFDVIPASMQGMQCKTPFEIHGKTILFAYNEELDRLTIRAEYESGNGPTTVDELIPNTVLRPDLPYFLTEDYTHWMDIASGMIKFRHVSRIWEECSSTDWFLEFLPDGKSMMVQGEQRSKTLVDLRSDTFLGIDRRLHPLELSQYLTVTLQHPDNHRHRVSVDLPRFGLSFFVNADNELESNDIQNMVIDDNQSTGTMIGLQSQLVLRQKDRQFAELPRSRLVIIPGGKIRSSLARQNSCETHVRVSIDTDSPSHPRKVSWYKYSIDLDLGMLVGDVGLTSRLFRIYLHALCSNPLPDPLTLQRGTEYALQELRAAGSFSFQQLTKLDVDLLDAIAHVTPARIYYPDHLRVMQRTAWSPFLPVLSQHGSFEEAVHNILSYAQQLNIFAESHQHVEISSRAHSILASRAGRNSIYYASDINISSQVDRMYLSRDLSRNQVEEIRALRASRMSYNAPEGLGTIFPRPIRLFDIFQKWGTVAGRTEDSASVVYTKEWLELELPAKWLMLYESCRQMDQARLHKFKLIFSFASLAYGKKQDSECERDIAILLACASVEAYQLPRIPDHTADYHLCHGCKPLQKKVRSLVKSHLHSVEESPANRRIIRNEDEPWRTYEDRRHVYFAEASKRHTEWVTESLMDQWPCLRPVTPFLGATGRQAAKWLDTDALMEAVMEYFSHCYRNNQLATFASSLSNILNQNSDMSSLNYPGPMHISPQFNTHADEDHSRRGKFTLHRIMLNCGPLGHSQQSSSKFGEFAEKQRRGRDLGEPINTTPLANLITRFKASHNTQLHQIYQNRLERSRQSLHGQHVVEVPLECTPSIDVCIEYGKSCRQRLLAILDEIIAALKPSTMAEDIMQNAGMWPSISHRTLLQLLNSPNHPCDDILITLAEAFIEYQHSMRLIRFSLQGEVANFFKELDNATFDWNLARRYPIWLLIQIQGDFITRQLQSRVAMEMIAPSSNKSEVSQLNMGEGKSQVITPLIAVALADTKTLVRVVVLKPLSRQMFQVLVERVSGLPNRRIFFLPFSRDVKPTPSTIGIIKNMFEECARTRGILVAQPEHILSLQLMVVDSQILLSEGRIANQIAKGLQGIQRWLHSHGRDILDESDELLHVRYQLIYTRDEQHSFDGGQERWLITQSIMDLVFKHMKSLHAKFPEDVELRELDADSQANPAVFPYFRLLGGPASNEMVDLISQDVLNGQVEKIVFNGLNSQPSLRSNLLRFITVEKLSPKDYAELKALYGSTALWKGLLLLRGLLAHGILVHTLTLRRWRVDFGLDTSRSLLAVPYRAKDVPSARSEFGHPDMIICLTCLAYYYGGLSKDQVKECFDIVSKLDNPALEYEERWVRQGGDRIPSERRQFIGVNLKDNDTFTNEVVPLFQHNKKVIDFYLARVVFPKEAKEFPHKLGTSGWDLAAARTNLTTGFSGTNDNADLLPTSIIQSDPANQIRTNAQVLSFLLQPENERYVCMSGEGSQACSAKELLNAIMKETKEIRVLLDVGAQMLEMSNLDLVRYWLSLTSAKDVSAGIFFDDMDNLCVVTRDGSVEPLRSSPFLQQLSRCIVYLDDAHTRGTDLKFPPKYRAMVTLGPNVTKDKLVQGCMRMRKLGHGQSVAFCAPPEIDRQIRTLTKDSACEDEVHVSDILIWAMANTCTDIKDHIPHWVQQGVYYNQRQAGYAAFSTSEGKDIEALRNTWLEAASRDLEDMFGLQSATFSEKTMSAVKNIPAMSERLQQMGISKIRDESMAEEQEREVSHEIEEETQIERPPPAEAARHILDDAVVSFVKDGCIPVNSKAFVPLMSPLLAQCNVPVSRIPEGTVLLGTRDFMTTTSFGNELTQLTEYLRPVNWLVSHIRKDGAMVIVVMSPFEVNEILDRIRQSNHVHLHIYAPRTSYSMRSFDDLRFYTIPPLAPESTNIPSLLNDTGHQLNIWAGQLYFSTYETYLRVCVLLGLASDDSDTSGFVGNDRFVPRQSRSEDMAAVCLFDESPIPLLKKLFDLRRKGMSFDPTHVGKILQARLLGQDDFPEI